MNSREEAEFTLLPHLEELRPLAYINSPVYLQVGDWVLEVYVDKHKLYNIYDKMYEEFKERLSSNNPFADLY